MAIWDNWPMDEDIKALARVALYKFTRLLEADEKEEKVEEATRWAEVKEQVRLGHSAGFRMIKGKAQEAWSGEND